MTQEPILSTDIKEYPIFTRGKVRDVYDMGDKLLIVATDRISAFDCILPNGIPKKGEILTQMSLFWFKLVKKIVKNHVFCSDIAKFPPNLQKYKKILKGRAIIAKKARRIDVECVIRGYLEGSGWKEYQERQSICGVSLPSGLRQCDALPRLIFTPAFKASVGHDENISFEKVVEMVGRKTAEKLKTISLAVYKKAHDYAKSKGILIADTKFEFGTVDGEIILIDEILSPDSSRFWPLNSWEPGHAQKSFDKQFVREYLEALSWDKTPPAPALPDDVVAKTLKKYKEVYQLLAKVKK